MSAPPIGPAPLPATTDPQTVSAPANQDWGGKGSTHTWDKQDGPSFSDLLDIINPLQHIPIVNTIYQHLTGDTQGGVAEVIGGTLYGGIVGLGMSIVNLVVEDSTGKDIGNHAYALFQDPASTTTPGSTMTAQDTPPAANEDAPPPPEAAPREAVTAQDLTAQNGTKVDAAKNGDYLVFGASQTKAPVAVAPAVSQTAPQNNKLQAQTTPVFGQSGGKPASAGGSARQGDFMVFGGSTTSLAEPATPAATQAQTQVSQAAVTQAQAAASPIIPSQVGTAHLNASTIRRSTVTPPANLPQPTTGPGALPGGRSQAKTAPSNDWFADAFSQNMDKYDQLHTAAGASAYQAASPVN